MRGEHLKAVNIAFAFPCRWMASDQSLETVSWVVSGFVGPKVRHRQGTLNPADTELNVRLGMKPADLISMLDPKLGMRSSKNC